MRLKLVNKLKIKESIKKPLKLHLVERKLNEEETGSMLEVSMPPNSFVKLTTTLDEYRDIENFIGSNKFAESRRIDDPLQRKLFIEKYFRIDDSNRDKYRLVLNLILKAILFMKPGFFNEEKSSGSRLVMRIDGQNGKVTDHEGRTTALYRWMNGQQKINVLINFENAVLETVEQMPQIIFAQRDDRNKVLKSDIRSVTQTDDSRFNTVEGFLNKLGRLPKKEVIDSYKSKNITVAGEPAILKKAIIVVKGINGKYTLSSA